MNAEDRRRTVVVGIDGSEEALRAVRWAVPEARRRRATLRLVTAFAWTDDRMVGWPGLGQTAYGDRLRAFAENGLTAAADVATELDPELPVERDLVLGFRGASWSSSPEAPSCSWWATAGGGGPPRHWRVPSRSASLPTPHARSWWSAARRVTVTSRCRSWWESTARR
jgi:hypothetical protein